jgi:plastocyanin
VPKPVRPSRFIRVPALLSLALLATGALVVGCSSSKKSSGSTAVTASEKEYKISLSQTTFSPGTYTFTINNVGARKHDLVFNGPGLSNRRSALVNPGSSGTETVTLAAGTYDVFCDVPTHKAKGMDLHITVP